MASKIRLRRKVGYSEDYTPGKNVAIGRSHGYSFLTIARQLQALANLENKTNPEGAFSFRAAAKVARRKHAEGY